MLIDTHCHLNFSDYQNDLNKVINDSIKAGVEKIICASSNLDDSSKAIKLAQKYPGVIYAMVGIHPQQTDLGNHDSLEVQIKKLEELILSASSLSANRSEWIAGIGECGLDYSPAPPGEKDRTKKDQSFLFEEQINLACKYNLPVCVHSRKSSDETVTFLEEKFFASKNQLRGVLHCYAAGKRNIQRLLKIGFYFGVNGNITYDEGLQNVIKNIPLERIILETDSPFLSPLPLRGLRNEPKNVNIIAIFLAKILNKNVEDVERNTFNNSHRLFNLK